MSKQFYVDNFRYWFNILDQALWDEKKGMYISEDAGTDVLFNASMLSNLTVMALYDDTKWARRISRIIENIVTTPPWDPEYHYWNYQSDRMGMEPHPGAFFIGSDLAKAYMYRKELDLPPDLLEKAMDEVQLLTAKRAEMTLHVGEIPYSCYVDSEGKVVDAGAIKNDAIRRGIPEDMRWLRMAGPNNQLVELSVAAIAFLATGREAFWDHVRLIWGRIIEKEENGKPYLFRSCMDPDYSFIYATDPRNTSHTHRYTQSAYALGFINIHAKVVNIARKTGRSDVLWEKLIRFYTEALLGRTILRDGSSNMVFNPYGWDRSTMVNSTIAYNLYPLITIADITPLTAGQIAKISNTSLRKMRELYEKGYSLEFPPDLGLKGFNRSGTRIAATVLVTELAEIILMDKEAMEIEEDNEEIRGCYSGFAWKQKHFVMQTPVWSMTVVGAGTPYFEQKGYLGAGMVTTGGEYVLKVPDGPYLTPLTDSSRTIMSSRTAGESICSSDVNLFNQDEYGFNMEVILPDGTRISQGEEYGPSPYDPEIENLSLEVGYGKNNVRMARRFDFGPESIVITDSIEALDNVEIEYFFSRLPIITVNPAGECVNIKGMAAGRPVEIKPPCHMGYVNDIPHHDQDFIKSVKNLEKLEISYPSGYGFTLERLDMGPVHIVLSRGEWQENRRMRVDGKNLDYYWINGPAKLSKGERRGFSYKITPLKY
ncbi:MAG: hypothetical protein FIA99_17175 [Ruminiclostridium sp.]|nr:hypothetical protein [Ruminiclostridium sp.]